MWVGPGAQCLAYHWSKARAIPAALLWGNQSHLSITEPPVNVNSDWTSVSKLNMMQLAQFVAVNPVKKKKKNLV